MCHWLRRLDFIKGEFGSFAGDLRVKIRECHADEPDPLWRRENRPDQVEGDLMQFVAGCDCCFHRSATGGNLEVSPFDFHGDGSAARVRLLAPPPDIICHFDHARFDPSGVGKVLRKGPPGRSSPIPTTFARGRAEPVDHLDPARFRSTSSLTCRSALARRLGFGSLDLRPSRCRGRASWLLSLDPRHGTSQPAGSPRRLQLRLA